MTTKIHAVVDAVGNPLRFILSPGQASDMNQAEALIEGLPADHVPGDKGYDAKSLRYTTPRGTTKCPHVGFFIGRVYVAPE